MDRASEEPPGPISHHSTPHGPPERQPRQALMELLEETVARMGPHRTTAGTRPQIGRTNHERPLAPSPPWAWVTGSVRAELRSQRLLRRVAAVQPPVHPTPVAPGSLRLHPDVPGQLMIWHCPLCGVVVTRNQSAKQYHRDRHRPWTAVGSKRPLDPPEYVCSTTGELPVLRTVL